jgi:hypothetical protein
VPGRSFVFALFRDWGNFGERENKYTYHLHILCNEILKTELSEFPATIRNILVFPVFTSPSTPVNPDIFVIFLNFVKQNDRTVP